MFRLPGVFAPGFSLKGVPMVYEYRIERTEYLQTVTDPTERQTLFDAITAFAQVHDVQFSLLADEYEEIAGRVTGNDAVVFTIEELDGMYKRKLAIYIVNGFMHEIYGVYNEYGEIMPFSYGIDYSMVM